MAVRAELLAEGAPCWADAMLPDVAAGKRFYGELFGWTFDEPAARTVPGGYTTARVDGRAAAGLFPKPDGRLPTAWNLHLAASDVRAAVARIREAGGDVLTEPAVADGGGTVAVAADPSGAVFGLLEVRPGRQAGFGVRGVHGAYVWTEAVTHAARKEAVDAFYTGVFGYGTTQIGGGSDFMMWTPGGAPADEEHAIGGRSLVEEIYPARVPAHFLTYFAVDDCDAAVHDSVRMGGRAVREAEDSPYGRYAVLADDQGTRFAVLETASAAAPGDA
ncbi:hydrolase [Streptomyces daqingensis]|uniref:Hydrolase n=1 Tax=Streptomyces daqingensis TaxID=1472640 RepID=A0ABQ2M271_9ACTN|nr:VOC family protein [Streptomyces daqingensis]GGO46003.1 hydrolase [Streptomyces daqingensis]